MLAMWNLRPSRQLEPKSQMGFEMGTILIIVLILLLVGAFPSWGYSRGWGYYPSGGIGLILLILIILMLTGRVNF
jgi:hypothetical protein